MFAAPTPTLPHASQPGPPQTHHPGTPGSAGIPPPHSPGGKCIFKQSGIPY